MASENLFSWLRDDVLRRPTYSRFGALLDNYNPHQVYKELVTQQDKHEEAAFIEEIARSAPVKYLHRYLVLKGVTSQDYKAFKKMLTSMCFDLYGRGGYSGSSSAFEHVFVGEIKGQSRAESEVDSVLPGRIQRQCGLPRLHIPKEMWGLAGLSVAAAHHSV